jgi:hypothetical protein
VRRLFWLALGVTVGVLAARRLAKAASAYTPEGISRQVSELTAAARQMADAVREGMAEREQELRVALGVDAGTVDAQTARARLEDPSGT